MKIKIIAILLCTIFCTGNGIKLQAQQTIENICMEGGGIKAFAYIGALQILDSMKQLQDVQRVAGTSGGAIIACLYAVGYSPNEMLSIAHTLPVQKFNDLGGLFNSKWKRVRKEFGLYKGDYFTVWLQNLLEQKTGISNITFYQLDSLQQSHKAKQLYIVCTDLSTQKCLVLCKNNFPNMKIADAVRASMSIPMVYKAVFINDAGTVVKNNVPAKHVLVDGGLLWNYPLQLFDSSKFQSNNTTNQLYQFNKKTLGLQLESASFSNEIYNIENLSQYSNAVYHTVVDKRTIDSADKKRTLSILLQPISSLVRKLPKGTIDELVAAGRKGAFEYKYRLQSN